MKARHATLVGTHLLALGLAYAVARNPATREPAPGDRQAATKTATRERLETGGDGEELLAGFLEERAVGSSKYQELKTTLPVADDPKAAVLDAIAALGGPEWSEGLTEKERLDRFAEVEVRVLHWMRQSPDEAVNYLLANARMFLTDLQVHVLPEILAEHGIVASWPWLKKGPAFMQTLGKAVIRELEDGGGIALLTQLQLLIEDHPLLGGQQRYLFHWPDSNADPSRRGPESLFVMAGTTIPFKDREGLFELARQQQNARNRIELLSGFARSSGEAREWLLEKIAAGELEDDIANQLRTRLNVDAVGDPAIDFDQRIEALQASGEFKGKPPQDAIKELVSRDVGRLLEGGRDWRYEFRHGVATLDEIVAAVRGGLSNVPPEGEEALLVSLYRNLVEEDAGKALPLLDSLPEDRRREALFHSTWLSQVNIDPDDYLAFFADLPEPETPSEKDLRTKGWNWKARGFLMRFGDDYVEWVKEMPEGLDKQTAMNSLIWATGEQNPAEARKLNEQLYPPKPNE